MPISDIWREALEELPEAAYFAYQPQARTPRQKRDFQGQFAEIQNRYRGLLGRQIMGGGTPTLRFEDFLANWFSPGGGAAQEWAGLTPRERGLDFNRFAPAARWFV